jgi:hypothetical protein
MLMDLVLFGRTLQEQNAGAAATAAAALSEAVSAGPVHPDRDDTENLLEFFDFTAILNTPSEGKSRTMRHKAVKEALVASLQTPGGEKVRQAHHPAHNARPGVVKLAKNMLMDAL